MAAPVTLTFRFRFRETRESNVATAGRPAITSLCSPLAITSRAGNATVTGGTGTVSGSPVFSGNTMTVNLTGVTDAQTLTVTLSGVTDEFLQVLPDTAVSANMLIGDTNGNGIVNSSDVAQTKGQIGLPVTSANFRTDVNASGTINSTDAAIVKSHSGGMLGGKE